MVQCVLDRTILNNNTIYKLTNIGLSIFAVLCGKNRGVFIDTTMNDPGNTYSCLTLPPSYQNLISSSSSPDTGGVVTMSTSNDIDLQFHGGNITGIETIELLDALNTAVFISSGSSNNAYDPYSCNLNGLSTYINCPYQHSHHNSNNNIDDVVIHLHTERTIHEEHHHIDYSTTHDHETDSDRDVATSIEILPKIRGVTTIGMIVPALWATTGHNTNYGLLHYTSQDFVEMNQMGLNTIMIPIPSDHTFWHHPSDSDSSKKEDDHHRSTTNNNNEQQRRTLLSHGPKEPKKHKVEKSSKKEDKHKREKKDKKKHEHGVGKHTHSDDDNDDDNNYENETTEPPCQTEPPMIRSKDTKRPTPSPTVTPSTSLPSPAPTVTPSSEPTSERTYSPVEQALPRPNKKKNSRDVQYLIEMIHHAEQNHLYVILQLVGSSSNTNMIHETIEHIIHHIVKDHTNTVIGLHLPSLSSNDDDDDMMIDVNEYYSTMITTVRQHAPYLPIFVPVSIGQLAHLKAIRRHDEEHIYSALSMDHIVSVSDIASSTSLDDRMKLYYHENVACTQRSPIEYVACYKNMPTLITSGFDIAIDNCAFQHDATFVNYGQCDRWDETIHSPWWLRHRQSLAVRKLASYEQGLGWIFAAWKVSCDDEDALSGLIETPAQLHSFKAVHAAGIFPDLHTYVSGSDFNDDIPACLNPPSDDFILGDETLSPVPAPPPDCGNGWWNYTIMECSYWVPPPPPPPCPICNACDGENVTGDILYNFTSYDLPTNMTDDSFLVSNVTYDESNNAAAWNDTLPTAHSHHSHHHNNNTIMNDDENVDEESISEGSIMRQRQSFDDSDRSSGSGNGYGLHHMGVAFIGGILLSIITIGFIFEIKKRHDIRDGYEVIPN